mmetsp:Transcript_30693/g.68838  ORF Transcript_30693/g.68838 Transcript_30693/m.68838 type:complete len:240 (-) Transcript_30693:855-1574(-)
MVGPQDPGLDVQVGGHELAQGHHQVLHCRHVVRPDGHVHPRLAEHRLGARARAERLGDVRGWCEERQVELDGELLLLGPDHPGHQVANPKCQTVEPKPATQLPELKGKRSLGARQRAPLELPNPSAGGRRGSPGGARGSPLLLVLHRRLRGRYQGRVSFDELLDAPQGQRAEGEAPGQRGVRGEVRRGLGHHHRQPLPHAACRHGPRVAPLQSRAPVSDHVVRELIGRNEDEVLERGVP